MSVNHAFVSAVAQGGDDTLIRKDDWNAEHSIVLPLVIGTFTLSANGTIQDSGGVINFTGQKIVCAEAQMTGNLNHDGSQVGLFGTAPVNQQASPGAATGELADLVTKFNSLLISLTNYGLLS